MSKDITLDELFAAWAESGVNCAGLRKLNDEGWTVKQMVQASGRSRFWVAEQVREGLENGTCERGWKHLKRIDGYTHKASVYKFKGG